jgi:hypothetical protein
MDVVFELVDKENAGELDYSTYMWSYIGRMSEYRKTFVRKVRL